jgi:hypothetical protein
MAPSDFAARASFLFLGRNFPQVSALDGFVPKNPFFRYFSSVFADRVMTAAFNLLIIKLTQVSIKKQQQLHHHHHHNASQKTWVPGNV